MHISESVAEKKKGALPHAEALKFAKKIYQEQEKLHTKLENVACAAADKGLSDAIAALEKLAHGVTAKEKPWSHGLKVLETATPPPD